MAVRIDDRVKRLIPLFFALIAMFASYMFAQQYIREQLAAKDQELQEKLERVYQEYPEPVKVVSAAVDIAANTPIEASHIKPAMIPDRYLQPYVARAPGEVLGLVTTVPIAAGEQILKNKIRRPQDVPASATLSMVVPKGKRAVTIVVDTITGVGGFVRPGDVVDVVWTVALPGEGGSQPITMTLFQDVPILAVERQLRERQSAAEGDEEGEINGETPVAQSKEFTVTMALPPQEISFLLFAREQGRIQLSLRPRQETGTQAAIAPVNIGAILSAMLGPQMMQGPPPPQERKIEIFRGMARNVVTVAESGQPAAEQAPSEADFPPEALPAEAGPAVEEPESIAP